MNFFAKIVSVITVCFVLVFVSVCSAQLSDLEQRVLHEEAAKLAKNTGLGENDLYKNLVFLYLAKQSRKVAENTSDPIESQHAALRADVYEITADALLKVPYTIKVAKELIADLEKEQATTVSPQLSKRINGVGNAVADALLTAAKMSRLMVDLASFEASQQCETRKPGYAMGCSEKLKETVDKIQVAMDIMEKATAPFTNAVLLGNIKQFTY